MMSPLMSNLPTSLISRSISARVGFGPAISSAAVTRRPAR
jgi:hypothetical protein